MPCPYFGNYPAEYNRAIHGPYDPSKFYGKPDTPLANVKLSELSSWIYRRNIHPRAVFQGIARSWHRFLIRFHHPRYASPAMFAYQVSFMWCTFMYFAHYPHLKHHERSMKHHW